MTFSRTAQTVYYRGRELVKARRQAVAGNFFDVATGEEYWVSRVKKRGSNAHWAERTTVEINADAAEAYAAWRTGGA